MTFAAANTPLAKARRRDETIKLVLLPGLDGTGRLFAPFLEVLPPHLTPAVISYPSDQVLSFAELSEFVRRRVPTEEPYAILAESFSGPVAIRLAASNPPKLRAMILCATFASSPAPSILPRYLISPLFFRIRPPRFFIRRYLLGSEAEPSLVRDFLDSISAVSPKVLSARLKSVMVADERAALKMSRVQILYLMAKRDSLVKRKSMTEIQRMRPEMTVVEIDGSHLLLQCEPARCAEAMDAFLSQIV